MDWCCSLFFFRSLDHTLRSVKLTMNKTNNTMSAPLLLSDHPPLLENILKILLDFFSFLSFLL